MIKFINNKIEFDSKTYPFNYLNSYDIKDIVKYQTLSGNKIDFNNLSDITYLEFNVEINIDNDLKVILHLNNCKLHSLTDFALVYNHPIYLLQYSYINDNIINYDDFQLKSKQNFRKNKLKTILND